MNRLTGLGCLVAVLALPSTAAAARLEPLAFRPLPDRAPALCLAPTGTPGGIALLGPHSRRDSATDLLAVGDGGATRSARVRIGRMSQCAAVAEAPGGAAVVAGTTVSPDYEVALRAVVRDPGGEFGEPTTLSDRGQDAAAAVGPAGHAVVAWSEKRGARHRIVAARRAPGGAFGTPQVLVEERTDRAFPEVNLAATVDAAGAATLVWSRELPSDDFDEHVEAATAAPGAPFVVQRLASGVSSFDGPVLAGAPDGRALAAFETDAPQVFERAPGGAFETVALPPLPGRSASRSDLAVAVRSGGGAVLAWRVHGSAQVRGVEALTRAAAGGPWSRSRVAEPGPSAPSSSSAEDFLIEPFGNPFDFLAGPPYDADSRELTAALSPEGRIALAWTDGAGRPPLRVETAYAVAGRIDGTFEEPRTIGAPLRRTLDVAALVLADGRVAAAWTDNADGPVHGRLHIAVEGAPSQPAAAAPRVTLRAARFQRLFAQQSPRVFAACEEACDLRAVVSAPGGHRSELRSWTRLRGGGTRLPVGAIAGPRLGRPRTVRVVVHATVPGAGRTTVRTIRIRVARRRALPVQRPLDVTARRRGEAIVVRWRTAQTARRQLFIVAGQDRRDRLDPVLPGRLRLVAGRGRTRFTVRLRPAGEVDVPWIAVVASSMDSDAERHRLVRVR